MTNSAGNYYIGIDSGGTKCELILTDGHKKPIFRKKFKGYHYSVYGTDKVCREISSNIRAALKAKHLKLGQVKGICIGLAGAREQKDRTDLKRAFIKKLNFKNISIQTDAMTGIYGAFEGGDGIILISGTGSVLYGINNGKLIRVGGWGRILGDYGAGYWLSKRGLQELVKEYDEMPLRKNKSLLNKQIEKNLGITKENIMDKVFKKGYEIQKAAPVILDCAERKDTTCIAIVNEGVEGLLYHIGTYLKLSGVKKEIKLAFIGSVVENKNLLSIKLRKEIKKRFKNISVVEKQNSAAFGAVLIAEKEFNKFNNR